MSNNDRPAVPISGATLIWAIVVMFVAVIGAAVILAVALPESQNPAALVGQLLAAFAALTGVIVTLFKVSRIEKKVDKAAEDTAVVREQTNGGLDHRIRQIGYATMRKALADHLDEDERPPIG